MAAPGKKFSFSRMMLNAIPNFTRDDANDVDLTPTQADNLVRYQLASTHPNYLQEKAFFSAGIVGSESLSKKVYKSLLKNGLILSTPGANDKTEDLTVNTSKISKGFASQMAVISVHAQRKLVGMLFFWEEECMRWKLLAAEEREILSALGTNKESVDLACALEAVDMKKKLLPSQVRGSFAWIYGFVHTSLMFFWTIWDKS
jgi:hypothetical protein